MAKKFHAQLSSQSKDSGEYTFPLYPSGVPYYVGRGKESKIAIPHPKISRRHARIDWEGDHFIIQDLASSNGTFINGERITGSADLKSGDIVTFYNQNFLYEFNEVDAEIPVDRTITADSTLPQTHSPPIIGTHSAKLIVDTGLDTGLEFILDKKELSIGRNSRNANWDIRLRDRSISRPHAQIIRDESEGIFFYLLKDLGSANGTHLNGSKLSSEPVGLANGDIIKLGETKLIFKAT